MFEAYQLACISQNVWEELHFSNERNAKLAAKCDRKIATVHETYDKRRNDVLTLQMLVSQIPRINEQIEDIMTTLGAFFSKVCTNKKMLIGALVQSLGHLESSFNDVEVALLALEDTIDAREMQEKQLEQRFQVAMYQEKRQSEFNQLSQRLQSDYEQKKKEVERNSVLNSSELQKKFQKSFEQDMRNFAKNGQLLRGILFHRNS